MANRVRYLEPNATGTDYVVGDLHGERGLLGALLAHVGFDPARDRLLCVGDLIDRGPDSEACAELLFEDWVCAVLGNHEDMLMGCCHEFLETGHGGAATVNHVYNGGEWFARHLEPVAPGEWQPDEWAIRLLARIEELPLVMVVGRDTPNRYNIVHAELPEGTGDAQIDDARFAVRPREREHLVWARSLMHSALPLARERPGLSPTYCGHTPDVSIRIRRSHICIDTGAVYPGLHFQYRHRGLGLTLVRPADRRAWKLHPEDGRVSESDY